MAWTGSAAAQADWPTHRRSGTLDGHSPAVGRIVSPKIAWSYYVGQEDYLVLAEPGATPAQLSIPPGEFAAQAGVATQARWGLTPLSGEAAGTEQSVESTNTVVYADILPDTPGLEKVEFESAFSLPTVNGRYSKAKVRCLAWRDGAWQTAWETPPMDDLFMAMPLAGDFDNDGKLEIAFLPWKELIVLDASTGSIKYRCAFVEGRSYGFFAHYDLDGDGLSEFVVQADFSKHVDVLGFRDGALKVLWQQQIELDIANPQKILRVNPNPVADVDGDGKLEVSTCTYNHGLGGGWQVDFFDGITGAVKYSLPSAYLEGLVDLDGDGTAEVLVSPTSGAGVSEDGPAQVFTAAGGKLRKLWEGAGLAWQRWEPPTAHNVNTGATLPRRTALCRRDPSGALAVLRKPAEQRLISARWTDSAFEPVCQISGPGLVALSASADGAILATASGTVSSPAAKLSVLDRQKRGIPPASLSLVHTKPATRPILAVQGSGEQIVLLHPPTAQSPLQEIRRISGRAQGENWPNSYGPVCADLSGTGELALIYATSSSTGKALLVAQDLASGKRIWEHEFPDIPGTAPIWNTGGIIYFQPGHFTDTNKLDVLVTVRRSMMHSEQAHLLSGSNGHQIWQRDRQIAQRGVGGTLFALADFDGDSLDDAASFHPSLVYILKGTNGADVLAKEATWEPVPSKPVYWGRPVAVRAGGSQSVFMAGTAMTALVGSDGTLRWWDALDKSQAMFALGDFDGDSAQEAIGAGYEDGIRCYDVEKGTVKWTVPLPAPGMPVGAASADLNGDGRDEAVFASGRTVYAIGVAEGSTAGRELWRVEMPIDVGPPCIASLDSPQDVAILVAGSDGNVFCIQ